jgi:hypothetical protein
MALPLRRPENKCKKSEQDWLIRVNLPASDASNFPPGSFLVHPLPAFGCQSSPCSYQLLDDSVSALEGLSLRFAKTQLPF